MNVNLHKVTSSSESPSNVNPEICCFTPNEQFFVYTMARTSYIQWANLHFIINRRSQLDFYSASSLKQQYMDRHVAPLGNMTLIPSKPVFAFILKCCMLKLVRRQQISIQSLVWPDRCSTSWSHALMLLTNEKPTAIQVRQLPRIPLTLNKFYPLLISISSSPH